jgi:hypothetical protein
MVINSAIDSEWSNRERIVSPSIYGSAGPVPGRSPQELVQTVGVLHRARGHAALAARLADSLDLLAAIVAGGLVILVSADRPGVPRVLLTLVFLFFVPGRAIVSNWPRLGRWSEAAMSMVLSLTVLVLLATVALWIHEWHPLGLFQVEGAASVVGVVTGTLRRHSRTARARDAGAAR